MAARRQTGREKPKMFSLKTTARRWPLFCSKDMRYRELGGSAERTVAKSGAAGRYDCNVVLVDVA